MVRVELFMVVPTGCRCSLALDYLCPRGVYSREFAPPSIGTAYTFELRAASAAGKSLEPPLPARGEPA